MSVQSEDAGKRRRTIWYEKPPAIDAERADVQKFLDFRFPDLRLLEELRQHLTLIRGEAAELQNRGFSDHELFNLKRDAAKLSGKIETLQATGTFPSR
jgi:hypothetical protein